MPRAKALRLHRLVLLLVTAVLLAAGCAAPAPTDGTQLNFTAQTLDGREFAGSSLKGRPAVLWFWAPWCPVCQRDAPLVARVAAGNPQVTFVGVGAQDEPAALQDFVAKYGVDTFTELADLDGVVWARFGVTRQPAYAFISPDGTAKVVVGSLSESELSKRVQALTGP